MSGSFEQLFSRMADAAELGRTKLTSRKPPLDFTLLAAHFKDRWFTTLQCANWSGRRPENVWDNLNNAVARGDLMVKRTTSANAGKPNLWQCSARLQRKPR
jgi:hypothetical protein